MNLHLAVLLVTALWATYGGELPPVGEVDFHAPNDFMTTEHLDDDGNPRCAPTRHIAWYANWDGGVVQVPFLMRDLELV
jgi:hypothetical protein